MDGSSSSLLGILGVLAVRMIGCYSSVLNMVLSANKIKRKQKIYGKITPLNTPHFQYHLRYPSGSNINTYLYSILLYLHFLSFLWFSWQWGWWGGVLLPSQEFFPLVDVRLILLRHNKYSHRHIDYSPFPRPRYLVPVFRRIDLTLVSQLP